MGICELHSDKEWCKKSENPPKTAHTLSKETKVIRYCLHFHGRYRTTIMINIFLVCEPRCNVTIT